jgi:hypothetical protein
MGWCYPLYLFDSIKRLGLKDTIYVNASYTMGSRCDVDEFFRFMVRWMELQVRMFRKSDDRYENYDGKVRDETLGL